jgi:hypothetical protein
MPRNLQGPSTNLWALDRVLSINEGGTSATIDTIAVQNLGGIHRSVINQPNGVAGLDILGTLPLDLIDADAISIQGPLLLNADQTAIYTITNYDTFTNYNISVVYGSVSRIDNVISYTAPAANGIAGFKINDRVFNIAIGQMFINKPVIQSPVNLSINLDSDVTFTTSLFDVVGGNDIHASSTWQLATDAGFSNLVDGVINSAINKLNWAVTGLIQNTTYYARVKHIGVSSGESAYSDIVQFHTA